MINKLQSETGKSPISKFFASVVLTGTTLLFLLQPGFSRSNEKVKLAIKETLEQYDAKKYIIQDNTDDDTPANFNQSPNIMDGGNDALSYATANVSTYYPDMVDHLTTMINSFRDQEHKEATTALLNEMVKNISNPAQKTGAIICALEFVFRGNTIFSDTYDSKITDETYKHIETFYNAYKIRFNPYYARLETNIAKLKLKNEQLKNENEQLKLKNEQLKNKSEQLKNELTKGLAEIETIMDKFTPNDVQKTASIKKLVTQTKDLFISANYTFSQHSKTLFDAIK